MKGGLDDPSGAKLMCPITCMRSVRRMIRIMSQIIRSILSLWPVIREIMSADLVILLMILMKEYNLKSPPKVNDAPKQLGTSRLRKVFISQKSLN